MMAGKHTKEHLTISHQDSNNDGLTDYLAIYSNDFTEPLIGDYRGVELVRIRYINSRSDSIRRAEQIAHTCVNALAGYENPGAVREVLEALKEVKRLTDNFRNEVPARLVNDIATKALARLEEQE